MSLPTRRALALAPLTFVLPAVALAHEPAGGGGFVSGLSHPVLGLDHLLAMVLVGVVSAQLGGRALWSVPLTFVVVMIAAGALGIAGIPLFSVETGIAVSVVALGLAVAADRAVPTLVAMTIVGVFALFHGHAHCTEMPAAAQPFAYAAGFVIGTAALHVAGLLAGGTARHLPAGPQVLRYAGAIVAGMGLHILIT